MRRAQAIPLLEHREQSAVEQALGWALRTVCELAKPTMRRVLVFSYVLFWGLIVGFALVGILDFVGYR